MDLLNVTCDTPEANLALDEALLDAVDAGAPATLRVWESPVPFVVVGYGNRLATEANLVACQVAGVPVLRRCSGGGTVIQGPGCLSYAVVLRIESAPELASVSGTNRYVMERVRSAIQRLVTAPVSVQGHTDLCVGTAANNSVWKKFSGNAQRRRQSALLFHGTLLLNFDLGLINRLLPMPSLQPEYRKARAHTEFITNLDLNRDLIIDALAAEWNAAPAPDRPLPSINQLLADKYAVRAWHEQR
jgi:lipoate-protein ligase A